MKTEKSIPRIDVSARMTKVTESMTLV
jgi:hypothetical protein